MLLAQAVSVVCPFVLDGVAAVLCGCVCFCGLGRAFPLLLLHDHASGNMHPFSKDLTRVETAMPAVGISATEGLQLAC